MDNKGIGAPIGKDDDVKRGKKLDAVRIRYAKLTPRSFWAAPCCSHSSIVAANHRSATSSWDVLSYCSRATGRDRTAWLSPPPTHRTPRRRSAGEQERYDVILMGIKKAAIMTVCHTQSVIHVCHTPSACGTLFDPCCDACLCCATCPLSLMGMASRMLGIGSQVSS